jgi:hypothetical protein
VISDQAGSAAVHPRLLIHKESGAIVNDGPPDAPIEFCEYADGANNNAGLPNIARADVAGRRDRDAPLSMGSVDR